MAAEGSLYGEGAQLLDSAGGQASNIARTKAENQRTVADAGAQAASQIGENSRNAKTLEAQRKLKEMELNDTIAITPQMALGLSRNTGDKEWLQAVGTRMRPDVMLSLYTHSINQKRKPQITQVYSKDGTIQHALVIEDETGVPQSYILDAGANADKIHPNKGGSGKGGSGSGGGDPDFKKNKQFLAEYDKRRGEYSDPIKASEIQKTNPKKYDEDQQWLKDNQDQYDSLTRSMGKAGSKTPAPSTGGSAGSDAPFDADSFIRDALNK